jgi:hypothetical protein
LGSNPFAAGTSSNPFASATTASTANTPAGLLGVLSQASSVSGLSAQ